MDLVGEDLKQVNQTILDRMHSPIALIPQLAGHIIAAGGKRLRPLLTLAAAKLVGYEGDRHITLAACIEFLHTATLLHDDVVDESDKRRGRDTANAIWGNKPSVLVGDFLFARSFELMVQDGSLEVMGILSRASAVISEGEIHQLLTANNIETTETDYLDVVGAKTAALFAAATRIGGVAAGRPVAELDALEAYGRNLGIAFQIADDFLDYSAREAELGKSIGDDFRDGKLTLPVIHAIAQADDEERAFWARCLEEQDFSDPEAEADLAHAMTLLARHDALKVTVARAHEYAEAARRSLDMFPDSRVKTILNEVADFSVARAY
ncbi:polyprenyl synthetase family protein [Roseospira navarrensis]|uniref:Octaprenyl diphosphate synthase n=1 Tax=Roseospira navarrensis TaxID=140058 RepID=A0A7X1ZC36_9PROT|nr:polyprenyl synthetase family protein [Roseospira navarrensis]MQX35803.1 polyprenyl synthetase family protein [Roseospira navarrensis]